MWLDTSGDHEGQDPARRYSSEHGHVGSGDRQEARRDTDVDIVINNDRAAFDITVRSNMSCGLAILNRASCRESHASANHTHAWLDCFIEF